MLIRCIWPEATNAGERGQAARRSAEIHLQADAGAAGSGANLHQVAGLVGDPEAATALLRGRRPHPPGQLLLEATGVVDLRDHSPIPRKLTSPGSLRSTKSCQAGLIRAGLQPKLLDVDEADPGRVGAELTAQRLAFSGPTATSAG
jgi:hypothetical protein